MEVSHAEILMRTQQQVIKIVRTGLEKWKKSQILGYGLLVTYFLKLKASPNPLKRRSQSKEKRWRQKLKRRQTKAPEDRVQVR